MTFLLKFDSSKRGTLIRSGEIDYLCIKSAEIVAKAVAKVIPESYSKEEFFNH